MFILASSWDAQTIKKTYVFQHIFFLIFLRFGLRIRLQKSRFFRTFFENVDFVKIRKTIEKPMVFIDFSRSEAPKIHSKSMPKRIRKKLRKNTFKFRFLLPFWPPQAS